MTVSHFSWVSIGLALTAASVSLAEPAGNTQQQAAKEIQAAYDAGQGKISILHWPSAWVTDEHSFHFSKKVQTVVLKGSMAWVAVYQDDGVAATDPKTGVRHLIRDTVTFKDVWKHTGRGWFIKKSGMIGGQDTIDGKELTLEN